MPGDERRFATATLGFYSDLQSIHSEDAITWSVFGPVIHAAATMREAFVWVNAQILWSRTHGRGTAKSLLLLEQHQEHGRVLVSWRPPLNCAHVRKTGRGQFLNHDRGGYAVAAAIGGNPGW